VVNNTTSFFTMLRLLPYGASKAALESMSAVWAAELEGTGVTVNVLVPGGPTDTELEGTGVTVNVLVPGGPTDTPFVGDDAGIPRDKMLKPAIMGPPIRWLASTASDAVTGQRFVAATWDNSKDDGDATATAGAPIGWPELGKAVIWPD